MEQDQVEDKKELTIDDALAYLELNAEFSGRFRKTQTSVERDIRDYGDIPAVILCIGDLHLGSKYTNYKALKEFIDFVKAETNVYVIINGDVIDNFDSGSGKLQKVGLDSQLASPSEQREIYRLLINELREKIIAINLGNHEGFSATDAFLNAANESKVALGLNRIVINLKFKDMWVEDDKIVRSEYRLKIAAIHKARFNSHLNPNHGNLRELHSHYPDADVIVTSHTHTPAIQVRTYPQNENLKKLIFIQTGTFKSCDDHSYKYFSPYESSMFAVQGLIVYPKKRITLPLYSLDEIKHMRYKGLGIFYYTV